MSVGTLRPTLLVLFGLSLCVGPLAIACGGGGGGPKGKQVILSTEFDDAALGGEAAASMAAEMGIIDDPDLVAYVTAIGNRMVPFAPQRSFQYTFHIVDQAAPNAFALPGGYIYVSRGLLQLVNSEDELAGVIGHEITHAAERHAAGRQEFDRRMNPFSMGWLRAGRLASYGRDQERDADRGGQIIASRAGYDPDGLATFLQDMEAMTRLTLGWSRLPGYFDSHPPTPERAATARNRAQNLLWQPRLPIAKDKAEFLAKLDGLILGQNPSQGIFRDTRFLHPDMNFSLRFPDGWQLINSSDAVGAVAPQGEAVVILRVAGMGDDPEAAARAYIEREEQSGRMKLKRLSRVRIGDGDGFRIEGESSTSGGTIGGAMTFIAHEGFVYHIDTMSRASHVEKYEGRGRVVVRSFRPLTPEEASSFQIIRLRVATAMAGESLVEFSLRTGNALDIGTLGVLNDTFIDGRLTDGQLLKVGIPEPYVPRRPADEPSSDSDIEQRPADEDAPAPQKSSAGG